MTADTYPSAGQIWVRTPGSSRKHSAQTAFIAPTMISNSLKNALWLRNYHPVTSVAEFLMVRLRTLIAGILAFVVQPAFGQSPKVDPALFARGVELYQDHCSVCHGNDGYGDGPLASGFSPLPRDLTLGSFKFRSTEFGAFPAKADILRTLEFGIKGSFGRTMPSFDFLSHQEKLALVEVVRFTAGIDEFGVALTPPARPLRPDLDRGQALFTELQCASCHGVTGDGNGPLRSQLRDEDDLPIRPTNLKLGQFKGGNAPEDIWMRIFTGIAGTPMPAFGRNTTPEDIWAVTEYVLALRE